MIEFLFSDWYQLFALFIAETQELVADTYSLVRKAVSESTSVDSGVTVSLCNS